jgi:phosphoribosylformylglycinamidine synthase
VVLAYHDRSDGGLLTTVAEMMFAGRVGAEISADTLASSESEVLSVLFNEELGAVFQVRKGDEKKFNKCFSTCGPPSGLIKTIGYIRPTAKQSLLVTYQSKPLIELNRAKLQQWWSSTSFEMQKLRDTPACAQSEFESLLDDKDPGLHYKLKFDPVDISLPAMITLKGFVTKPRG